MFDQTLNLSTVAFLLFIVVLATTAYVVGLERQHREETSKLEAKIAAQDNQIREQDIQITELRDMVIYMRERMWPGESHGNSTSINVSGGPAMWGNTAGRDVNQANAGGK